MTVKGTAEDVAMWAVGLVNGWTAAATVLVSIGLLIAIIVNNC